MNLDRLTINLPWPDSSLFPNRKGGRHWTAFQKIKESARKTGFYAAQESLGAHRIALGIRTPIRITFVAPDRRNRDWDGLAGAIKHQLDGIADALGVDDRIFRPVMIDTAIDEKKQGFVLVEIGAAQ